MKREWEVLRVDMEFQAGGATSRRIIRREANLQSAPDYEKRLLHRAGSDLAMKMAAKPAASVRSTSETALVGEWRCAPGNQRGDGGRVKRARSFPAESS